MFKNVFCVIVYFTDMRSSLIIILVDVDQHLYLAKFEYLRQSYLRACVDLNPRDPIILQYNIVALADWPGNDGYICGSLSKVFKKMCYI